MSQALKPREIYGIAHQIAEKAHAGQFRELPDGRAYIEHCKDVAAMMPTWELKTVAILHDTIEDTREEEDGKTKNEERKTKNAEGGPYRVTEESLLAAGIPKAIVDAVVAMTKPAGTTDYLGYVRAHVLPNEMARKVKLADNYVNLKDRLAAVIAGGPEAEYTKKKVKEYVGAIQVLIGG